MIRSMKTHKDPTLAALRAAAGQTVTLTARLMGEAQPVVSRLESGKHRARLSSLTRYYAAVGRFDLVARLGTVPGAQICSDTLDTAMRYEARFGTPEHDHEVVRARLEGRLGRVRAQAAVGRVDRARLLEELDSLATERRASYQLAAVRTDSSREADRVVQFVQDMCTVTEACEGDRMGDDASTKRRDVARAFNEWAERNGGPKMGERAFFQRISQIEDLAVVRQGTKQVPAFNVVLTPEA